MSYSDEQLIINYLNGDHESLDVLIKRYLRPIYNFVYRYTGVSRGEVEDITQEVFVKTWHSLKKFDKNKSFKTWLFSIAKNTSIDFLKKKKTIPFSEFESEEGENMFSETLQDPVALTPEILERKDLTQALNAGMEKLSREYRLVLALRYNDHFTFREIAESLKEPLDTVKSRHRRALIQLKKLLAES